MKKLLFIILASLLYTSCINENKTQTADFKTICNPVDISYRFCLDEPSRREAADPTIVWFKDKYFLFASKSGGYWHSEDLISWTFIEATEIPIEDYAPTVIAIKDTLYFMASSHSQNTIYKTTDPIHGTWEALSKQLEIPVWDPALFLDDDDRLYLYWGCSNENPLYGVEIDYKHDFSFIGKPIELKYPNSKQLGWEVPGNYNTIQNQNPWIEGAWVNKYNGKYYLQYSGPGTEYKSYCDAVYVSENPLGPFSIQPQNPFAYKPEGYTAGAGHGSTFADKYGNFWHIGTITISQKQIFERRLGLYPAFFDEQGLLYSITKYSDYPMIMPQQKISSFNEIFPEWMLLSYAKNVQVSSSIDSLSSTNITDENIRTYWAAQSGDLNENAILDLGESADVYAIQINFAEHNTVLFGRQKNKYHRYTISYSNDRKTWSLLLDKSKNETDNSHAYFQLAEKISCRYIKINNIEVPSGNFALSGLRVFGKGYGETPQKVKTFEATRNPLDKRSVSLYWENSKNATGYTISYGIEKNKLYNNYMVYKDTTLVINSLDTAQQYFFTIEAFNQNGITKSEIIAGEK